MRVSLTSQRFGQEFTNLIAKTTDGNLDNYLVGKNKWGEVSLFHKRTSCIVFLFYKIFCGYHFNTDTLFQIKDRLNNQCEAAEVDAVHAQDHIKIFLAAKSIEHIASHIMTKRNQKRSLRHVERWVELTERITIVAQTFFQYIAIEKDRSPLNYASAECHAPTAADVPENMRPLWKENMLTETLRAIREENSIEGCDLPTRDLILGALKRNDLSALMIVANQLPEINDIPQDLRQKVLYHLMDRGFLDRAKELLQITSIDDRKLGFVGAAIHHNDFELATEFLDKNAGPDARYKNEYPIRAAFAKENADLILKLYEKGSRISLNQPTSIDIAPEEEEDPFGGIFRPFLHWTLNPRNQPQALQNKPTPKKPSLFEQTLVTDLKNQIQVRCEFEEHSQVQIQDAQLLAEKLIYGKEPEFTHAKTLDTKLHVFNMLESMFPGLVSENKMSLFAINKDILSQYEQEVPDVLPNGFRFRSRLMNLKNIVHRLDRAAYNNISGSDMNGLSNFITKCERRLAQTGTPGSGTRALEKFYEMVERAVGQAVIALEAKEVALRAQQNPEIAAREKTELATMICKIIKELGQGASACGGRTLSTATDAFRYSRTGHAADFESLTEEALGELRGTIFDSTLLQIEGNNGEVDAHAYNRVIQACGRPLGIPAVGIYDEVRDTATGDYSQKKRFMKTFFESYTPRAIFTSIRDKINTEGTFKELYIDWWKTHIPQDFKTQERKDAYINEWKKQQKDVKEAMILAPINQWKLIHLSKKTLTKEQMENAISALKGLNLGISENALNKWQKEHFSSDLKNKEQAVKELIKLIPVNTTPVKELTEKEVDDALNSEFLNTYVQSNESGQLLDSGIMKVITQLITHVEPK